MSIDTISFSPLLINQIHQTTSFEFLLELESDFTFIARQKRIPFDDSYFRSKNWQFKHQDLGQIQMHVTYYDREVRLEKENKIIGIVLSKDKNESVVKYTLPEKNEHIFASKYKTVLQSKDELKLIISERKR